MDSKTEIQNVGLEEVAEALDISSDALKNKIANQEFSIGEVWAVKTLFNLSNEKVCKLFRI